MFYLGTGLLVAAAIIRLFGYAISKDSGQPIPAMARVSGVVVLIVGLIFVGLGCLVQVPAGNVNVAELFGDVDNEPIPQGLHPINPLKRTIGMSVQTQELTMHAVPAGMTPVKGQEGDSVAAISADGMQMPLDATVFIRLVPGDAPWVYQNLGTDYVNRIVVSSMRTAIREAVSQFVALEAFGTRRDDLALRMQDLLRKHIRVLLDEYPFKGEGVIVQQLLLRNIGIPDQVRDKIEKKLGAEQDALAMQYILQKETQEAERKRIEAKGIADFQQIVTQGISDKLLAWKGIEATLKLAESQNAKVVVVGSSQNGGLPIIFDATKTPEN